MANMQQSDHCGSVGVEVSVEAFKHDQRGENPAIRKHIGFDSPVHKL